MFRKRLGKWLVRTFVALAAIGIIFVAGMLLLLRREHSTALTLPEPTGRFPVGRTVLTWINNVDMDELAPSPGTKRQVVAWIWYPSAPTFAVPAEYLPGPWRSALAQHSGILLTQFLTRDLSLVRTHSTSDADVSPDERSFPVVIMRAGGGALTADFTTLAEDLSSHGYIVVGFDAPYRTSVVILPDRGVVMRPREDDPENLPPGQANALINRLLPLWTGDAQFVVSQLRQLNAADPSGRFTGRLDMQRLGMFGHSFGGAQTLQFCHDDPQCKAGIDLDGAPFGSVVQEGLEQPFMFVLSDHSRDLPDPDAGQIMANFHSIYSRLPKGGVFVTIRGANHFSFSDQILLKSQYFVGLLRIFGFGGLDGRRGLAITAEYVHTFFDVYLKGAPPTLLTNISARYPEVQAEVH